MLPPRTTPREARASLPERGRAVSRRRAQKPRRGAKPKNKRVGDPFSKDSRPGREATQFRPGHNKPGPGRPKGSAAKEKLVDVKSQLPLLFESATYYEMVRRKAVAGTLAGPVWRFYLECLHGKPSQKLEHGADQSLYDLLCRIDPDDDDTTVNV